MGYYEIVERGADPPRAKRSLGQNFLKDPNIARKIVSALEIGPEDTVLEIGPGPGALTGFIRERGPARLVLVEKDAYWAGERMKDGGLAVVLADALRMPWERLPGGCKVIGNLPYNVASPIMWDLFSLARGLGRAVFMIQKEVGQRVAAGPDTSAYGALSVWVQSFVKPKLEFIVPPQVFHPRPKVDSAVLSFTPLAGEGADGSRDFSPADLSRTLKLCFQMRRKQLGSIARALGRKEVDASAILEQLRLDSRLRPEHLTVRDFHRLSGSGVF